MKEATLLGALGQVGSGEAGAIFRGFIHEAVRSSFIDVMLKEVETLCGPSYRPFVGNQPYRSGSAPGVCILDGCSERVVRPRVRHKTADGSEEMRLASYNAAKDARCPGGHIAGAGGRCERQGAEASIS